MVETYESGQQPILRKTPSDYLLVGIRTQLLSWYSEALQAPTSLHLLGNLLQDGKRLNLWNDAAISTCLEEVLEKEGVRGYAARYPLVRADLKYYPDQRKVIRGDGKAVQLSLSEDIVFAKLALNPRIVTSRSSINEALGKGNSPDQYDLETIKSLVFLV